MKWGQLAALANNGSENVSPKAASTNFLDMPTLYRTFWLHGLMYVHPVICTVTHSFSPNPYINDAVKMSTYTLTVGSLAIFCRPGFVAAEPCMSTPSACQKGQVLCFLPRGSDRECSDGGFACRTVPKIPKTVTPPQMSPSANMNSARTIVPIPQYLTSIPTGCSWSPGSRSAKTTDQTRLPRGRFCNGIPRFTYKNCDSVVSTRPSHRCVG